MSACAGGRASGTRSPGPDQAGGERRHRAAAAAPTLVAGGASPEEVFAAVAGEVGRLLGTVQTNMLRYDPDDVATIVAVHGRVGDAAAVSVGDRYELGGRNATTLVFETGRPARIDGYSGAWGAVGRAAGYRSSVGVPISVEGRLWGVIGVASTRDERLPADIEARLAGFTELVATAVANAQARVELRGFAEEQAALRRVATLVAGGASPEEVFTAVPRGSRAAAEGRLHGGEPVRRGRPGHGRRRLGQDRPRPPACYRPPPQTRGTEHPRTGIPDRTASPNR
jgi:hypothetical protein